MYPDHIQDGGHECSLGTKNIVGWKKRSTARVVGKVDIKMDGEKFCIFNISPANVPVRYNGIQYI